MAQPTVTNYLRLQKIEASQEDYKVKHGYFSARLMLSGDKTIQIRRFMDVLQFLRLAGGMKAAVVFLARVLHFLCSGKTPALEMLRHHFVVNENDCSNHSVGRWASLFWGTKIHRFVPCSGRRCSRKSRLKELI